MECQKQTEFETIFNLPIAMTVAKIELEEVFNLATEDDCTVCSDEISGNPTFSYDQCSFVCQKTDMIGEVCRYTDISNSVRSRGVTN